MEIIAPNSHPTADKVWREQLGSKPNGARTLGSAQAKYLAPLFEPYYDEMVCYASDYQFEIPEGAKRIAVMVHQNYPWVEAFKIWQRTNVKLKRYEVDYFANEPKIVELIRQGGGKCFYLPRFIDTTEYPIFSDIKKYKHLWFGNPWNEFKKEFEYYKDTTHGWWICHGRFGRNDKVIKELNRFETLRILSQAKEVWAIGVSQLEAQYYGCKIVSYRDGVLPFYNEDTIQDYTKDLLEKIWRERRPRLGK